MNKNIDVLKYLMAIFIVMIHSSLLFNFPLLRCAVPVFFIISSYLFFDKIQKVEPTQTNRIFINFIRRASKLYLFWFVVLIPYMVITNLMLGDIVDFLEMLPFNILLRSTFPASWYLAAYIIGISIIYKFRKHNIAMLIIGIIFYIACCGETNYGGLLNYYHFIRESFDCKNNILVNYLKEAYLSFPVGLIFIIIGKYIAERKYSNRYLSLIGIFCGIILLFIENKIIINHEWRITNDCYLSTLLLAPSIFQFTLTLPQKILKDTAVLRKMSTIYYCTHIPIITLQRFFFKTINLEYNVLMIFMGTIALCTVISAVLINLASIHKFRILKYSY